VNQNCYGGMCNYNPWSSNTYNQYNNGGMSDFYANQQAQMGAQVRQMQQQAINSQDAQVAQQALYESQQRYQQVLGNANGGGYGGGGGYYGGGGGYYGGGYIPAGGVINNPPAGNGTRF